MPPRQMTATAASSASEAALVERWIKGPRGAARTEDGREIRVLFPGVPGPGPGPDVRDAVLELAGDAVRGDIEVHLRARGWYDHGHHHDPAYGRVVLHLVAVNDGETLASSHASGTSIPIAVAGQGEFEGFAPPCSRHLRPAEVLADLGVRRLRSKASSALQAGVGTQDRGQVLYELLLKTCGGPVNGPALRELARTLPLGALLERADHNAEGRAASLAGLLLTWAERLDLSTRCRPAARPVNRLERIAPVLDRLWPHAEGTGWPLVLRPDAARRIESALSSPGLGAGLVRELIVNAVLPAGVAAGAWRLEEAEAVLRELRAPGRYGRLNRLGEWVSRPGDARPFAKAAALQGGLLLHREFCARGRCGACPLSG